MITYRGVTIPFAKHSDETTVRASKVISYPAVNGTHEMDMGKRQKTFSIQGLIVDLTGSFNKTTIENWNDGSVGTLTIHETNYTLVKMQSTRFAQAYKNAVSNKIACTFTIEFRKIQ